MVGLDSELEAAFARSPNMELANSGTSAVMACVLERFSTEVTIENFGSGLTSPREKGKLIPFCNSTLDLFFDR